MEDPRQVLERASERRVPCELLPRAGSWCRGHVERVERGGVVVVAPGLRLGAGEDLRCWFALEHRACTFEASVIRQGVPVQDRSQSGFLLGFIQSWSMIESAVPQDHGIDVFLLPPNGPAVSLVHGPGRLVELRLDRVCFTLPVEHKLVFVEQGLVRLRYSMPGLPHHEAEARVAETVHEGALRIYALRIGSVSDPEAHRCICSALARVLDTDQP